MPGSFTSLVSRSMDSEPLAKPSAKPVSETLPNVGRRSAARLRLSIPAKIITVSETRRCVLLNLSRTGAQIGLARPMAVGEGAFLNFADIEVFGTVMHASQGTNGLEFDLELTDAAVLATRQFAESCEVDERRALLEEARAWVTGRGKS